MTFKHRVIITISTSLILVLATLAIFGINRQNIHAAPPFLCVAPGGTGCDIPTCGTCYSSIQDAVDDAGINYEIRVATGTYTGVHAREGVTQVLYISKTISVRGGYNSDLTTWDPDIYSSTLDAQRQGRVVYITGTVAPTLDSLILTGGNATGLLAGCKYENYPDGCGGGIYAAYASPIIAYNVITNNIGAMSTGGPQEWYIGSGGGIYLYAVNNAEISHNIIISNVANLANSGYGGGIFAFSGTVTVDSNKINENIASKQDTTHGVGGGMIVIESGATIKGNLFKGNWANSFGSGVCGGLFMDRESNGSSIINNTLIDHHGNNTIYLLHSNVLVDSNYILDNHTNKEILIGQTGSLVGPTLVNNIIHSNGDIAIFAGGSTTYPVYAELDHNTLVGDGDGNGIYVESDGVYLVVQNNIVTSYTMGITNTYPISSTINATHNLFWNNVHNGDVGLNPVFGDPAFVDPNGDFHIGSGSAAIDAALPIQVGLDIDGDVRPMGPLPDIGADETRYKVYLPLIVR